MDIGSQGSSQGRPQLHLEKKTLKHGWARLCRELEEWDIPEALKKQQISESLRGPAAKVICNFNLGKQDYVASDYVKVLYVVFRQVEKLLDLL